MSHGTFAYLLASGLVAMNFGCLMVHCELDILNRCDRVTSLLARGKDGEEEKENLGDDFALLDVAHWVERNCRRFNDIESSLYSL